MKKFLTLAIIALSSVCAFAGGAADFFADAQAKAKKENKNVFLIFSGVEWCGPCQMYDAKLLKSNAFKSFAKKKLVVVDVDTKRDGNRVVSVDGKELKVDSKDKEAFMAAVKNLNEQYPHRGVPYSLLLDEEGKVLETVKGFDRTLKPKDFVKDLKSKLK